MNPQSNKTLVSVDGVEKVFHRGSEDIHVLSNLSLQVPAGEFLPHDQCPMATALKEGRPIRGLTAVAKRPDGTRVVFMPYPTPAPRAFCKEHPTRGRVSSSPT